MQDALLTTFQEWEDTTKVGDDVLLLPSQSTQAGTANYQTSKKQSIFRAVPVQTMDPELLINYNQDADVQYLFIFIASWERVLSAELVSE